MEKINLNKKHRLKQINELALVLQDTKLKSLAEIRRIAETIELLSDDKILKGLNRAMDDFKHGRYTTEEVFMKDSPLSKKKCQEANVHEPKEKKQ